MARADGQITRRRFLTATGTAASAAALGISGLANAQIGPGSAGPADPALIEDLVAANRILVRYGVLDGMGHVSVRHNLDRNRFLISRSLAPSSRMRESTLIVMGTDKLTPISERTQADRRLNTPVRFSRTQ